MPYTKDEVITTAELRDILQAASKEGTIQAKDFLMGVILVAIHQRLAILTEEKIQ